MILLSCMLAVAAAPDEEHFTRLRHRLVDDLRDRGIRDAKVLEAMRRVPRHLFVPGDQRERAYDDLPLAIGSGQTISQPYIVAYMTQAVRVVPGDRVLEIGTGSGYQAAILSLLAREVYSIEIVPDLAARAGALLRDLGYANVRTRLGDGWAGWPERAPFDVIVVTAAPPEVPRALVDQLAVGGRLIIPVGTAAQELRLLTRTKDGIETRSLIPVRFVPMTGGRADPAPRDPGPAAPGPPHPGPADPDPPGPGPPPAIRDDPAPDRPRWSFAFFGGSAWNAPTPLTIRQSRQPDIDITAHYHTRPFEDSPYYLYRVGRRVAGRGWEFEFLHHKLYLANRPDEVQRFEITHGFNVLSLNRVFYARGVEWRTGGGLVIAHPESTVRGLTLSGDGGPGGRGYYLVGALAQGAAGRRFFFGRHFFVAVEGKITLARVEVPVEDGEASVPNVALHGAFGAGSEF